MLKKSIILFCTLAAMLGAAFGLRAQQPQPNVQTQVITHATIHDIVRDIQQYEAWTILQYFDKEDNTGIRYYRFKLQRYDGKLVIIDVDPMEPDLRALTR